MNIFLVAFETVFPALVLNGEVLPFLNIAKAVIAVGEVFAVHAEVIGDNNKPCDEYRSD